MDTVTGGQTDLFVPLDKILELGRSRINTIPLSPAVASFTLDEGPAVHFPVNGGLVESSTMLGTVNNAGGLQIVKYKADFSGFEKQLDVTDLKIVNGSSFVGNALGLVPTPAADLINATHSKDPATGVIHYEADAQVSAATALVLNTYFDTTAFTAGMILGHLKSNIQTNTLL